MLSSQTGAALSGAGSAAGKSAGHGAVLMGAGVRAGFARGLGPLQAGAMGLGMPGRFEPDKEGPPHVCSGSDADSDSGDEDEPMGSIGDGRRAGGVKRERAEMEAAMVGPKAGLPSGVLAGGVAGAKPGKKTRGRVKIKMEFIDNKLRRYTTFSKRKTGIMKKAYELSTQRNSECCCGASETGTSTRSPHDALKPAFTVASVPGSTSAPPTVPSSSTSMQASSGPSFPITSYLPPAGTNGAKSSGATAGVMQLPAGFTFMSGSPFAPGTLGQLQQHSLTGQSIAGLPATVSLTGGTMQQQLQTIQVQSSGQSSSVSTSSSSPEISHTSTASTEVTMVIGQQSSGSSTSLTELQVINLDASQNAKNH
ncbi:hypothetical protein cypCar_00041738 [Cyprinus carpio]|nr:hypothetical protein cypCar_00041738 [Cyprinus carpio]